MVVASSCTGFAALSWPSMAGLCHKARHKFFFNFESSLVPTRSGFKDLWG